MREGNTNTKFVPEGSEREEKRGIHFIINEGKVCSN